MNCIACGRPLLKPAFTMRSRGGILAWGPKCARKLQQATGREGRRWGIAKRDTLTPDLFAESPQ